MRLRSLRFPDLALWHADARYSVPVRLALVRAYSLLQQAPRQIARYADAMAVIEPVVEAPMSVRQRVRMYYVIGMAFSGVRDYESALVWLDKAVDLAYEQADPGDLLDLLYLRGAVNRGALHYGEAALDYREYLAIAEGQGPFRPDALDTPITLDAILQLAGAEFFRANYTTAQRLLERAAPLLPYPPDSAVDSDRMLLTGTYAWFQSQLYRWRGMPEGALLHAAAAARIYTEHGSPASAARSQLVWAHIALDIAARAPHEGERRFLATVALPHIELAQGLVREAGDPIGECLCTLIRTRMSRLAGQHEDRISAVEQVVRRGRLLDDEAVLAQAFTALGDELAAQGDLEAAVHRYRDVRMLLDGSEVPALEVWARRAIHHLEEQHPALG